MNEINAIFDRASVLPVILSLFIALALSFALTPVVKWLAV